MRRILCRPLPMLLLGALLGVLARVLDQYTQTLGNLFSELSVWVLLGALIALGCPTLRLALACLPLFCWGMLAAYYFTAWLTHGVYGAAYILGWTLFSLASPAFAWLVRRARQPGLPARSLAVGLPLALLAASALLFDGPRFYDWIAAVLLLALLLGRRPPAR